MPINQSVKSGDKPDPSPRATAHMNKVIHLTVVEAKFKRDTGDIMGK